MAALLRFPRNKSLLFKIVFSYAFIGWLFIGGFSYVVASKVSNDLTVDIQKTSEEKVVQSFTTADALLSFTNVYFGQLFTNNSTIAKGMYGKGLSRFELYEISQLLGGLTAANPLVDSIYIYNPGDQVVFSSHWTATSTAEFPDTQMMGLLQDTKLYRIGQFLPRRAHYNYLDKTYDKNLISIVYSGRTAADGALVVNLDQKVLQAMVTRGGDDDSKQLLIMDRQGTVVSASDSRLFNAHLADQGYVKRLLAAGPQEGYFTESIQGKEYLVSYTKADRLGWTFVSLAENDSLFGKVNTLKRFILWVTGIFVLLVAVTGGFFTRMIYTPINRLVQKFKPSAADQLGSQELNEYDLLTRSFSSLESKIQELQEDVSDFLPAKKSEVLRSILCGGLAYNRETDGMLQDLGIRLHAQQYVVCLLRIDSYHALLGRVGLSGVSILKLSMVRTAAQLAAGRLTVEVVDDTEDAIAIIAGVDGDNAAQQVEGVIAEIRAGIGVSLGLTVTAALGTVVEGMDHIPYSWTHARRTSQYRIIYGTGSIIPAARERADGQFDYEYPLSLEKAIMDALKLGDRGKLHTLVDELISTIRQFSYDEMMISLNQLTVVTVRTAKGMVDLENEPLLLELNAMQQRLHQLDTLEQIRDWYVHKCEAIIGLRDLRAANKNAKAVGHLIEHIHNRYSDPNLSAEALAELAGLSTNYLRKVFKEQTGQSMSNYLSEVRFQKAQVLLTQTDYPANKISEMVGFDNTSYFYVSFKKYSGKTPDQYRKEFRRA